MYYTLITGGSRGFGRSMAFECARRGMNLILVASREEGLKETARDIVSEFNIDIRYFPVDLTEPDAPKRVYDWCCEQHLMVGFLINNAGTGGTILFSDSLPEYSDKRILLNIRALTLLTRYFIPMLQQCPKACILNIASLAGYFPIPYKSVYSASKAYVIGFSKSLSVELKPSGIHVSVACPGGIETNEGTIARIKAHKYWGKWTQMESDKMAKLIIDRVLRKKKIIIPLFINRLFVAVSRIFPSGFLLSFLEKEFRKEPHSN